MSWERDFVKAGLLIGARSEFSTCALLILMN